MSFQSFIAHNGISHQKPSPAEKPIPSNTEAQTNLKQAFPDSQTSTPKSNSTSKQQILEVPKTKVESLNIKETDTSSYIGTATLVPGFGESIFTLLIASPFFLLGFKKWLHR